MSEEDIFLLSLAVSQGILTQEQADDCQTLASVSSAQRPISEILLAKSMISEDQEKSLKTLHRIRLQEREDQALARYLFDNDLVEEKKLKEALSHQRKGRREGKYRPLDRILVAQGLVEKQVLQEIQFKPQFQTYLEKVKRTQVSLLPKSEIEAEADSQIKVTLGGYELRDRIAIGGMGTIHRAWQIGLERIVALKILSPNLQEKPAFVEKFIGEAKMAARLCHPNLVHVYEIGSQQSKHFYSMELVEGANLHEVLVHEGRLSQDRAIDILLQIAKAIRAIHEADIIHRDIKPDNIIIRTDGIAKLVDLGLAKESNPDANQKNEPVMGNPHYIAPEYISKPDTVDFRADIYSLGATFYRMLTGRHAIDGDNPEDIVQNLLKTEPTPIGDIDHTISEDVEKICRRMMKKDPARRYMSMDMVVKALERLLFIVD